MKTETKRMMKLAFRPFALALSATLLMVLAFVLVPQRTDPKSASETKDDSSSPQTKASVASSSFLSINSPTCDTNTTSNTIIHTGKDAATLSSLASSHPDDSYLSWLISLSPSSTYSKSLYIPTLKDYCKGIAFHWTVDRDQNTIQIAVAAQIKEGEGIEHTGGYVAVGFSENGGMRGSDVVYFTSTPSSSDDGSENLSTNTNILVDGHILDSLAKPMPDKKQDWSLISQSITSDGYIIFEAQRSLTANDPFDRSFVDDSSEFVPDHKLIGAWGIGGSNMMYHGHNRVKTSIQLFHSASNSGGGNLGYYYDNFLSQMNSRSEGNVVLNATQIVIPEKKTFYYNRCISTNDLVNLGFFPKEDGAEYTSIRYILGYEFIIQNETKKYMHHIVIHGHTSIDCEKSHSTLFIWTPGEDFFYFPDGAGMKFGGSKDGETFQSFNIQYHIDNQDLDTGKVDTGSGVRIYYSKTAVDNEIGLMQVGDPRLKLQGQKVGVGQTRHVLNCPSSCTQNRMISDTITVVRQQLHMHSKGKRVVNQVLRDGSIVHENYIDYWDYEQNGAAAPLSQPFEVKKGDAFRTICYYDADANDTFGTASEDEMCIAFIFYFPKQPLHTCGVLYERFDQACNVNYEGRKNLTEDQNFDRVFGGIDLSAKPSIHSSIEPSQGPSTEPSKMPSSGPSIAPSLRPSTFPSLAPTLVPTTSNEPTQYPFPAPSSEPTIHPSGEPSYSPSISPSSMPFSSPSSSPSYMLQEFQFSIAMDFDILDEFQGHPKKIFENIIRNAVKIALDDDYLEDFEIIASIEHFQVISDNHNSSRRSLTKLKSFSDRTRNTQQENQGLRIVIKIYADVRSATTYTTAILIESVKFAFDEEGEREAFIMDLQTKDAETFAPINKMSKFAINNTEIQIIEKSGPSALIYICIGAGGGMLIFSFFAFIIFRRIHDTGSSITNTEIERMNSPVDPKLHRTIECSGDPGDVSIMADTYFHPGSLMYCHQPLKNDNLGHPNNADNFDYRNVYGGVNLRSMPSHSTSSSTSGEKILVFAPPGHLGLVIGTPSGEIEVHGIEEESVLYNQIQIGDKLISIDGQSTTGLRAESVSKLIGSKAMNPRRDLVFLRPTQGSQCSNI